MKVYDFLGYCMPSQEIEIWIKPLFSNRYTRYTADICDEIRNDQWTMDTLKAADAYLKRPKMSPIGQCTSFFAGWDTKGESTMKESKITDTIPNESAIHDRIEELTACIHNFPESILVPVWQNAIDTLKQKLTDWSLPL